MHLTSVIVGPVVTEKAEGKKATARTYTLTVNKDATKIDVKNALRSLYGVEASSVRSMRIRSKTRRIGQSRVFTKRSPSKRMLVTLTEKSPALDLSKMKTA